MRKSDHQGSATLIGDNFMDLNTMNLDPDPEFCPNFNPDPGLCYEFEEQKFKVVIIRKKI